MTRRSWNALGLCCLIGMAAPLLPARADNACIDRCFSTFSPSENNGSTEPRDECLQQCNRPRIAYGAIAYGAKSTANGYAYGKASMEDASRAALANCRQHGDDCQIAASFSNVCMAVAAVESKARFATGQGTDRNQSQANAMKACQAQVGGKCEIEVWTCAGP